MVHDEKSDEKIHVGNSLQILSRGATVTNSHQPPSVTVTGLTGLHRSPSLVSSVSIGHRLHRSSLVTVTGFIGHWFHWTPLIALTGEHITILIWYGNYRYCWYWYWSVPVFISICIEGGVISCQLSSNAKFVDSIFVLKNEPSKQNIDLS